jgi:hypothetical protein
VSNEVYGAEDKRGINERRNALYANASAQNGQVAPEELKNKENSGVHHDNAKAERENNNRPEDKGEDWFQDGI